MSNGNGNTNGRQSILSAGLEILKTQGAATLVLLLVIWIGREASLKWLEMQSQQVASNVTLTENLSESMQELVACQRDTAAFQQQVRSEHTQQTELLLRATDLLSQLVESIEQGNRSRQLSSGGS